MNWFKQSTRAELQLKTTRWRLSRTSSLLTIIGAFAALLVASTNVCAENPEENLEAAGRAYRDGNYRLAMQQLASLSDFAIQLPLKQQLTYWDLQATVTEISGLPAQAEQATLRQLALLRDASVDLAYERREFECKSLARLARIKRARTGAEIADGAFRQPTMPELQRACELYRQAIQTAQTTNNTDTLWEAETRFELARTLELVEQPDAAKAEYANAVRAAETALTELEPVDKTTDEFLRGAAVVRQAFLSDQDADERRQAAKALRLYQARLQTPAISPLAREKLLSAIAACYRQSDEPELERQVLEQLVKDAEKTIQDRVTEAETLSRAEAMVRLAELFEAKAGLSPGQPKQLSNRLYREAKTLYVSRLSRVRSSDVQRTPSTTVARQPGSREASKSRSIGDEVQCLVQLQLIDTRLEDWTEAIKSTNELLKLRELQLAKNDPNYYRTQTALGVLYAKRARAARMRDVGDEPDILIAREDVRNAHKYLSDARAFWEEYQPQSSKDLATTLNYLAEVLRYEGEFRGADELLNELAAIWKSHRVYGVNDLGLAEFYTNRAAVQAALGQYFPALANYREAANIAGIDDANERELRERRRLLALVRINVAQLYKSQRQLEKARRACEAAFTAGQDAGFIQPELVPFQLANASLLIAEAERQASRLATSSLNSETDSVADPQSEIRNKLERAVGITASIAEGGSGPLELATARHLQALAKYQLYELCGGGEQQLHSAEQLWSEIFDESDESLSQIVTLGIRASNHLVTIALRDLASMRRQAYELSLAENRDEKQIAALASRCDTRLRQANTWSQRGEQRAGEMVAYPAVHVRALLARANVMRANAKIHEARAKSLRESNIDEAAKEAAASKDATDEAIAKLREAVKTIEMPRAMTVGAEEERAAYFAQFAPIFDLLVDLLFENGRYIEAIEAAEMRRSRTFQDQLRAGGVNLNETADPELVKTAEKARDRYYATLARLDKNWSNKELRDALTVELDKLRSEFVAAEQEVKSNSPAARQLLLEAEPTVRASAPDENEWIGEWVDDNAIALIYYVGAGKSYVFACGREIGVIGERLRVNPEQARRRGLSLPPSIGQLNESPLRADHVARLVMDVSAEAQKLPSDARRDVRAVRGSPALKLTVSTKVTPDTEYLVTDILLPPGLRQKIVDAGPSHLIVVPDGALHQLPLELLPYERERKTYVLDTMPPISYAPSLQIYRTLRNERRFGEWEVALVSLADPSYRQPPISGTVNNGEILPLTGQEFLRHRWGNFSRLEGFKKESNAVCAAFQQATSKPGGIVPLVDKDATEEKLRGVLEANRHRVGFLHIAAHGLVSQEYNNLFGAVALTPPNPPTATNDGFLSLHEVFSLPLKGCEMVVLSACETNCGAESPLEASSTMARAFICAGAKRVVCSHWGVDDEATTAIITELMERVSSDLAANRTIEFATALHAAKKRLRETSDSPYFWAPFVLIGPPSGGGADEQHRSVAAGGK